MLRTTLATLAVILFTNLSVAQSDELLINIPDGSKPWTSLKLEPSDDRFQFAIVTDRTGGLRPGVFNEAVDKINLLRPPFVMSVGDLITGYTEDTIQLIAEWEEFDAMVQRLEMPFFYLPGNHDITNQVMEDLWKKRLGPTYYHFVYKDVLFLCLNSEDQRRGAGRGTISDKQYEYIEKALTENSDVRWTFVFLHQPLWDQANPERWPDVENLLQDREHSVFAGHVHHYQRFQRNNGRYYTLATTGGGSRLRGPRLGEFDHISWVTMTSDGPVMANIALDGIHADDVTTREDYEFIQGIYSSKPVRFEPLFAGEEKMRGGGMVKMQFHNPADQPMHVQVKPGFSFDYLADIPIDTLTVGPNNVVDYMFSLKPRDGKPSKDAALPLAIDLVYTYNDQELRLPLQYKLAPQIHRQLGRADKVKVDGKLKEWEALSYEFGKDRDEDCSVHWDMKLGEEFLYVAAQVKDDEVVVRPGETAWQQDFIGFIVNADPLATSIMDNGAGWYRNSMILTLSPETKTVKGASFYEDRYDFEVPYVCEANEEGYVLEAAVPLSYIQGKQGENWQSIRVNFVVQDEDPNEKDKPRMTWQPDWRGKDNVIGSGVFWRE
ncbi:MAG: metallophosphoesterase [Bacteroidota bacterium]